MMRSPSVNRRRKGEVLHGSVGAAVRGALLVRAPLLLRRSASSLFLPS